MTTPTAGTISKGLVFKIRDILGDLSKGRIKNNTILYDLLSQFQREFMTKFNTNKATFTINITTDMEYAVDTTVNKVIKVYDASTQKTEYRYTWDETGRKIVLSADVLPVTGDKIYYDAYLKPLIDINSSVDPVIPADYHPYLIKAVLVQFPTKDIPQTLEAFESVKIRVMELANSLKGTNRFKTSKGLGQMNFF